MADLRFIFLFTMKRDLFFHQKIDGWFKGSIEGHIPKIHKSAINKVLHIENSHVIATGDDDGVVKVWDLRLAANGKA